MLSMTTRDDYQQLDTSTLLSGVKLKHAQRLNANCSSTSYPAVTVADTTRTYLHLYRSVFSLSLCLYLSLVLPVCNFMQSWFGKAFYLSVSLFFSLFLSLSLSQRTISMTVTVRPVRVRCSAAVYTISVLSTLSTTS